MVLPKNFTPTPNMALLSIIKTSPPYGSEVDYLNSLLRYVGAAIENHDLQPAPVSGLRIEELGGI